MSYSNIQQHSIAIHRGDGRVIGKVDGDTFYKSIRKSHYLQRPPAIAFDIDSLKQAEQAGAVNVQVTDRDDGTVYKSTVQHIREKGKEFNRGYGDQIFLTLDGWVKSKPGGGMQLEMWDNPRATSHG